MDNTNWDEYKQQFSNICVISGVPAGQPVKSFKTKQGEQFYDVTLEVLRTSHAIDRVPVTFSIAQLKVVEECIAHNAQLTCYTELRTKFVPDGKNADGTDHMHLVMSLFTRDMFWNECGNEDQNDCHFLGELGRVSPLRNTPSGKVITDFNLKVPVRNRLNKMYYIPCISWGHIAEWVATLPSGSKVAVDGRLQSRDYKDKNGNVHTINELSVYSLMLVESSEGQE